MFKRFILFIKLTAIFNFIRLLEFIFFGMGPASFMFFYIIFLAAFINFTLERAFGDLEKRLLHYENIILHLVFEFKKNPMFILSYFYIHNFFFRYKHYEVIIDYFS